MTRKFSFVFSGLWVIALITPAILFAADKPSIEDLERGALARQEAIGRIQAAIAAERARIAALRELVRQAQAGKSAIKTFSMSLDCSKYTG
jgi:hypothetical protein